MPGRRGNIDDARVLAAERKGQADLIEARTRADALRLDAEARAAIQRVEAEAAAVSRRLQAESDAEAERLRTEAQVAGLRAQEQVAAAYAAHPALLRLRELEALRDVARCATARIYIGFDRLTGELPREEP